MGRPRTITDESIVETAREVFLEQGPGASTAAIAERMGISQASLFKRFGTKEELQLAALHPPEPLWQARLAAGPDARPIREQIHEVALDIAAFMEEMIPRITMLRAAGIDVEQLMRSRHSLPPPLKNYQLLVAWFESAMAQGRVRPGIAEIYAITLVGSINATAFFEHLAGQPLVATGREKFVSDFMEMFWRSLDPCTKTPTR
jgi:AcrR family transcriptional regulator